MAGPQRLLAMAMTFFVAGAPGGGGAGALGMVVQAEHASLGSEAAAQGTTIYDGDRLSTGDGGSLQLMVGQAMLSLAERSDVIVHGGASGARKVLEVELVSGNVVLSATAGSGGEIVASSAHIRPLAVTRGVVQVRIVTANELIVFARRGAAEVSYRGESETIAEGKAYRVQLNAAEGGAGGAGDAGDDQGAKPAQKRRKALILILLGAGAVAAAAVIIPHVTGGSGPGIESPDRP